MYTTLLEGRCYEVIDFDGRFAVRDPYCSGIYVFDEIPGGEGCSVIDWFGAAGEYLGPDGDGVEPRWVSA